jgi:hypothetical protein
MKTARSFQCGLLDLQRLCDDDIGSMQLGCVRDLNVISWWS